MESGYEKINPGKKIPAMIAYLDRETIESAAVGYQPAYIPPHWHRSIEMSLVVKGSVELWINKEKKMIRKGEFIFVNSGCVHQIKEGEDKEASVMMVILSYDFLKKVYPDIDQMYFELKNHTDGVERIREIYGELIRYSISPGPLDYIKVNAYLYELLYILLTECAVKDRAEGKSIQQMNHRQKKILNYIEENYKDEITLKMLAEKFEMSEEHFSRKFHEYFAVPFKTYIDRYRIYRAYEDTIQSDKSMQYIALEHGFPNVKSFISHFKKEYGVTPYQYRKQYRKQYRESRKDNF